MYAKLTVPVLSSNELAIFEVRNTFDPIPGNRLILAVQFDEDLIFQGKTISHYRVYVCSGRACMIIKGNNLLAVTGLQDLLPPSITKREAFLMIARARR
jgi:hypothetical protein